MDGPEQAAALLRANNDLRLGCGVVIGVAGAWLAPYCIVIVVPNAGVPVPEEFAADAQQVEDAIQLALREANKQSIAGNEITPFILKRVSQLTGGASLKANVALIKHNAAVGAAIAKCL